MQNRLSRFAARNAFSSVLLGMLLSVICWAQPAIPQRQTWEAHMVEQGSRFCNQADINAAIGSAGVVTEGNVWYYDGTRVYDQIAAYTGQPSWFACAGYVDQAYRNWVLAVTAGASWPVGALNGWRIFPHGLLTEYRRTGSPNAREALLRLARNSAFSGSGGGASCEVSRETAYIMNAYLAAEDVGEPRNPLLATAVSYALGHVDQWFVTRTCPSLVPFMVGLTLEALINYYEKTGDVRIPTRIRLAADELWKSAWVPTSSSFYYDSSDKSVAAPDLSLLIAPAYAWLWQKTGVGDYLQHGDQVFAGGVLYANFWSGKQFSQNYRWSFDYVKWRSSRPRSLVVRNTAFMFNRGHGTSNGKLVVTNTGSVAVSGKILLVELMNLTPGVKLMDATGTTGGSPFIAMPGNGTLAPGESVSVKLQFKNPSNALIAFTPIAY